MIHQLETFLNQAPDVVVLTFYLEGAQQVRVYDRADAHRRRASELMMEALIVNHVPYEVSYP